MSGMDVICPKCGGVIDEKTLKCTKCGTQYTKEEYEELKSEQSLKNWLLNGEFVESFEGENKVEDESLKRWLQGDESAFFGWTEEAELGTEKVEEIKEKAVKVKEAVRGGEVNVDDIIKENLKLKSLLDIETSKREELEKEVEKLRKQIEIIKQESLKELPQDAKELKMMEMELRQKEIELEMREKKMEMQTSSTSGISPEEFENLKSMIKDGKINDLLEQIKDLTEQIREKDGTIEELKNELKLKEEEMKKLQDMINYKEEEIARREQDLMFREKKLEKELRNLQMAKSEMANLDELTLKKRLEDLKDEIKRKEEELRVKMKYLDAKERELKAKMEGLVEEEIAASEEEIKSEIKEKKVKTGTRRLDDLLYGGIPIGSNVLIYGPPYSKKEVLIYSFVAEGLRKGVPVIWVLTDKTVNEIREAMSFVIPTYEQYEKLGIVHYIDAYSRSIGETTEIKGVIYLNSQTDVEGMTKHVEEIAKKIKEKFPYYRLAFVSLSTVMAYMDQQSLLKFLQPFTTRRNRDKAVSLYLLEKGLHSENEIQMVGYLMDGMIEFKMEAHKTFLTVHGVTEVQSRGWIEVTATKSGLTLGSFSLGHIR